MEVTTQEEVTRTYCDVCGKDITHDTRYGAGTDKPEQNWVTCSGGEYILDEGHSKVPAPTTKRDGIFSPLADRFVAKARLNCADIALLRFKYPELLTTG